MNLLLAFRVSNFRSIAHEQELSFVALDDGVGVIGGATPALPALGIYGPNASGKSTVVEALAYARQAAVSSHRVWDQDGGTSRVPHMFSSFSDEPSKFDFEFVVDGEAFVYRFTIDDERVLSEELLQRTTRRPRQIFVRELDDYRFSRYLPGPKEALREITLPHTLFLSIAGQVGIESLRGVTDFFQQIRTVGIRHRRTRLARPFSQMTLARRVERSPQDRENFMRFLRLADLGIDDLSLQTDETDSSRPPRLFFQHRSDDIEPMFLPYDEESDGTVTWLSLVNDAMNVLSRGGLLVVDELDRSLHPHLTAEFLRLFQDESVNSNGAQLLFTSHDVTLLRPANPWRLRRDQLWLTEKGEDGATSLYPATDFRELARGDRNLERLYLEGRLGAVPVVDESEVTDLALATVPSKTLAAKARRQDSATLFDAVDADE